MPALGTSCQKSGRSLDCVARRFPFYCVVSGSLCVSCGAAKPAKAQKQLHSLDLADAAIAHLRELKRIRYETPSIDDSFYGCIIIVDDSATGLGAFVKIGNSVWQVSQGWKKTTPYSAWTEPLAATTVFQWAKARSKGPFALITDHLPVNLAIATGQRRPCSGNGRFSSAFHVNEFFVNFYAPENDSGSNQIFYVERERERKTFPMRKPLFRNEKFFF